MAFTEQGVAMLSGLLNSDRAIEVNIAIMRTFVKLRRMLEAHAALAKKLAEMEQKYDGQFKVVFEVLAALTAPPEAERRRIGFSVRERRASYRICHGQTHEVKKTGGTAPLGSTATRMK